MTALYCGGASRADIKVALANHPVHQIPPHGSVYSFGRVHRDRFALTGYRMELGKRTRAAFQHLQGNHGAKKRFLVVARPRSGSTLLVELLHQVQNLRCDGEMLHFASFQPAKLLDALATTCVQDLYGCKVLSYQMLEVHMMQDPVGFLEQVQAYGFKFIHLRRNTFPQSMSLSKAQHTNLYHDRGPNPTSNEPKQLALDEESFRKQVAWNLAMLSYEDLMMSAVSHMRVQYEDDLATPDDQQTTVDNICAMMDHQSSPVQAKTRKVSTISGSAKVENYDRLRAIAAELTQNAQSD